MQQYGLLGEHLTHSYSPQIHSMLADYPYTLCQVKPEALPLFMRQTSLAGMNVTIPYKKAVLPYCSSLSQAARRIGSVNTLVRTETGWHGDNTDYDGFCHMVRSSGINVQNCKALVLGNGGVSLTVQQALADLQASKVVVISRKGEDNYANLACHADAQLIVNATPVGMYPHNGQSPVDLAQFPRLEGVLDLVYNPERTALMLQAQRRGIACAGGLVMLVAQARRAAELFTGQSIADEKVSAITATLRRQMQNLILIGMPGSGKSAVGAALARQLHRPFYDADAELERSAGCTIAELFSSQGESAFRALETKTLQALGQHSGAVIATGGGCITRPDNYDALHQNGLIIWLQRPLQELPIQGRPLSQKYSLQTLYAQRKDAYASFADVRVENTGPVQQTVEQIVEELL